MRRGRFVRARVGLAALVGVVLAGAVAPATQAGVTERVNVSSAGDEAQDDRAGSEPDGGGVGSGGDAVSADGRYVSFRSFASNLVAGDSNNAGDVFVRDRQSGKTRLVSIGSGGAPANGGSYGDVISADGRYVAFESTASNLVADDTNNAGDVFVHDIETGETRRVSVSSTGAQGNVYGLSSGAAISADGRYVAFTSRASNLVADDTNGNEDIFVHDLQTGETRRVSVSSDGTQANNASFAAAISADGRYVAFDSIASNLVAGDTNIRTDVFLHDLQSGETRRVSVSSTGAQANGSTSGPSISGDGRYVAFGAESDTTNLVAGDTNDGGDVFVHDRQTGDTQRVSVSSIGAEADIASRDTRAYSQVPSISADGRYISFYSNAPNLVAWDTNDTTDLFVHDRQSGETRRVSVSSTGAQGNDSTFGGAISADGHYVAFTSDARNLVANDTNASTDVFVHDIVAPDVTSSDTLPPRLELPGSLTRETTSSGTAVSYLASATDDADGVLPATCSPASGATFPIGATTVRCTATDAGGNLATGTFTVTVTYNDGFEGDLASWNTSGSAAGVTLSRQDGGHSGASAVRLANTAATAGTCTLNDAPNRVQITTGGDYTARVWVRADTPGQTLKLRLREYKVPRRGGALVGSATAQVVLATAWQPVSVNYEPAAVGRTELDFNAYVPGAAPGVCFYADDVSLGPDQPPPPAPNLSTNSGFENDLAGWNTSGSAAGVVLAREAGGHSGGWAARLANTAAGAGTCTLNDSPNAVKTTAAGGYTATLWVRGQSAGQTLKLRLREYTGTTLVGSAISDLSLTTGWQQASVSYVPKSAGASTLDLNAYVSGAPPGTCFLADDATITSDFTPPPPPNLIANSGFEADLAGWNTSGSAAGIVLAREAGGHSGGWAARVANTAAGAGTCTLNDSPNVVKTTATGGYTATLWVRGESAGQTLRLRLREYAGTTLVGTATSELTLTTAWQQASVSHVPKSPGASTLDLNAYVSAAPPGTCFLADDATIEHN